VVLVAATVCCLPLQAAEKHEPSPAEDSSRDAILQAMTSAEAGKAYGALFKKLDRGGLLAGVPVTVANRDAATAVSGALISSGSR
jgi:hypothetical protein